MGNINVSNGFKWTISLVLSIPLAFLVFYLFEELLNIDLAGEGSPSPFALIYLIIFAIVWFSVISLLIKQLFQKVQSTNLETSRKSTAIADLVIILLSAAPSFLAGTFLFIKLLDFENSSRFAKGPIGIFIFVLLVISFYALPFLLIRKILGKLFKVS